MGTDPYSKTIPCPAHPNGRAHWWSWHKHQAILFCHGSRYAGIWECPVTGESDTHEHADYEIETTQVDYWPTPDIDRSYDAEVYVCGGPEGCGVTINAEVADPVIDRADAIADMRIMEALGK